VSLMNNLYHFMNHDQALYMRKQFDIIMVESFLAMFLFAGIWCGMVPSACGYVRGIGLGNYSIQNDCFILGGST
ncbi:hypothetical protein ACJX0J_028783, partial [Zea mays]